MAMSQAFPGFLYAKSLRPGDPQGEGYKTWFFNAELDQLRNRIEALRTSFRWRPDSSRRYPPVMVFEAVEGERILVVRFLDAGKDPFRRPQTLRMEALLVPVNLASRFWDGTFTAEPDPDQAAFVVDGTSPATDFPGWKQNRLVRGKEGTFSLNVSSSCSQSHDATRGSTDHERITDVSAPQQPTSCLERHIPHKRTIDRPKKCEKVMCKVLFALLIVSCVLGGWNYFQSMSEIEQLRNDIEIGSNDVVRCRAEIEKLKKENDELLKKIDKYDGWMKTRSNFELNKEKIKIIVDKIINDFREAENLLMHMDEAPNPTFKKGQHGDHSDYQGMNSKTNNVRTKVDKSQSQCEVGKSVDNAVESSGRKQLDTTEEGVIDKVTRPLKNFF